MTKVAPSSRVSGLGLLHREGLWMCQLQDLCSLPLVDKPSVLQGSGELCLLISRVRIPVLEFLGPE